MLVIAILALIAALLVLASPAIGDGPDEVDAGGTVQDAKVLEPGIWEGGIERNDTLNDTADFFSIGFEGGTIVSLEATVLPTSSTHLEVNMRVLDRTGVEVVALSFPAVGAPMVFATLTNDDVEDPVYYVGMTWDGSLIPDFDVDYSLVVEVGNFSQDDAGTGGDVNSTAELAHRLTEGWISGMVGGVDTSWGHDANADGRDMYTVMPEPERFLNLDITLEGGETERGSDLIVTLENSTGGVIDQVVVSKFSKPLRVRYYPVTLADVFVNVSTSAVSLNYTITVSTEEPGADAGKRADAGEDPDHAMDVDADLMTGVIMRGLNAEDPADFFELEFDSGMFVQVWLTLRSGTVDPRNVVFHVYDLSKAEVVNFTFSELDTPRRFASLTNSRFPTLRYYLSVTWEGDDRDFEYRYELKTAVGFKQNDLGQGKDITNESSGAPSLSLDSTVGGTVGGSSPQWGHDQNADGADVLELLPSANQFLVVQASLVGFNGERRLGFDVKLEDQSGTLLGLESVFAVGESLELRYFAPSSQPVYAVVVSESESCDYTIRATTEPPPSIDLSVGEIALTPSKPTTGTSITVTVTLKSSTAAVPSELIRVELYAGGDLLESRDIVFEGTDEVVQAFTWRAVYGTTTLTVHIDTLDAIPFETDEDNNSGSVSVEVRDKGANGNGNGDDAGLPMWTWVAILVIIIVVAIVTAVAFVVAKGHGAEDEEPEDY